MSVISDVSKELFGMFVADVRLTVAVLAAVGATAGCLKAFPGIDPAAFGFALLGGCLLIIVLVTASQARRANLNRNS